MVEAPDQEMLQIQDALVGEGLPAQASWHLGEAAAAYRNDGVAERHLHDAVALAPGHPAVLIGLYRFYFYKGRLSDAIDVARVCLTQAAGHLALDQNWRQVHPHQADFGNYAASLPRFYMFTLKAYAYLQLRLGRTAEGHEAVLKCLELDPTDKVGAGVLLNIVQRIGQDEDA
jgi:tetratricopeptide (TPR) repeat protein